MSRHLALVLFAVLLTACFGRGGGGGGGGGSDGGADGGADDGGQVDHGDVGASCTGDADCAYACLDLEVGSGVCVDLCPPDGTVTCPEGYRCNALPNDAADGLVHVCLPNASCPSDLDFQGRCEGSVLRWCGNQGPETEDCARLNDGSGQALVCEEVNPIVGFACVSPGFTPGCGGESLGGRCEGNDVVYCESHETGVVRRTSCPGGEECAVTGGVAGCREPNTSGCGSVTYEGFCNGSTAVWCSGTQIRNYDCSQDGATCGWVDDELGYWCVPVTGGGPLRVRGTFRYLKRPATTSGLGLPVETPVRQASVQVRRSIDDAVIASGTTDDTGAFDIAYDATGEVYVSAVTVATGARYSAAVRDCPLADCSAGPRLYAAASNGFTAAADTDLGVLVVRTSGTAGAFNIFDALVRGVGFAWDNLGEAPPAITARWEEGSSTICGTSCFSGRSNTIFVLGVPADTDEFDDAVLGHEFGHFLEHAFSRSDSPGGSHDGSPTDPRLAWGEGYGTWVGSEIQGSPIYIDTRGSGATVIDVRDAGIPANLSGGLTQPLSEYTVTEILWSLAEGTATTAPLGTGRVFDVLGGYLPGTSFADRGVRGVDLVDFLDGWFCRGHGNEPVVRTVVNDGLFFPYDYQGPASCP